jgi:hypothetical protein
VSGLTIGDYFLWNWSLNSNHDVLALVSGLTLPPLAVAALWMLVLTLMRLMGHVARTSSARADRRSHTRKRPGRRRGRRARPGAPAASSQEPAASSEPSRQIAA